ncbi:hypothetical protein ACWGCK_16350 [Streptomyces virginiae]
MSDKADWVAAAGGVVGAIGGPAGLWAAWNVHRQNRRRRFGPPEELVGLLAKVLDVSSEAPFSYRRPEWFEETGIGPALERIEELNHLVSDIFLGSSLQLVVSAGRGMTTTFTYEHDSQEQIASVVARQARDGADAHGHAKRALKELRRAL